MMKMMMMIIKIIIIVIINIIFIKIIIVQVINTIHCSQDTPGIATLYSHRQTLTKEHGGLG